MKKLSKYLPIFKWVLAISSLLLLLFTRGVKGSNDYLDFFAPGYGAIFGGDFKVKVIPTSSLAKMVYGTEPQITSLYDTFKTIFSFNFLGFIAFIGIIVLITIFTISLVDKNRIKKIAFLPYISIVISILVAIFIFVAPNTFSSSNSDFTFVASIQAGWVISAFCVLLIAASEFTELILNKRK